MRGRERYAPIWIEFVRSVFGSARFSLVIMAVLVAIRRVPIPNRWFANHAPSIPKRLPLDVR